MNRRAFIRHCSSLVLASALLSLESVRPALARPPYPIPVPPPSLKPGAKRQRTIVIDPGHGGVDPGAIGGAGTEEKHVVLNIAEDLAGELGRLTGAAVRLTREKDVFLPLEERVAFAQDLKADLFVSVHADSAPTPDARGLSVYTLSNTASDKLSAALATRENQVDTLYGVDLGKLDDKVASILFDLARRETLNQSIAVQHRLVADLGSKTRLLERPARSANFAVLRSPAVPAVLIETGFLSNGHDEALLRTPRYRRHLAGLIAHAVADCYAHTIVV
jgi:N-acetylmuramoyl-L-alanine amidase